MTTSPSHTPWGTPPPGYQGPARSLVLSGGGIRLSYQAGVLRALAETDLRFAHMDATSGGALNLAMLLSGQQPEAMCERWRTLDVRKSMSLMPLDTYLDKDDCVALGSADGFVRHVLPHLGINLARVRAAGGVQGTFNVLNYGRKVSEAIPHQEMDVDLLIAGLSLPGVMPPVRRNGALYLDAAFVRDANLMEAVRRGAEELWVVWCLGNTDEYRGGPLRLYVQMLEMAANSSLNREFEQIEELNERIRRGDSPYGQRGPIRLHLIRPEYPLPLDPDLYLGRVSAATLIDLGYADARRYLAARTEAGLPFVPETLMMKNTAPGITFRETMKGGFALGVSDPREGERRGREQNTELAMHATVAIRDLERFINDPEHAGSLTGSIDFAPLGQGIPTGPGVFNLFSSSDNPRMRLMVYELPFVHDGEAYYLAGRKEVQDDPGFDAWSDTTTLYTRLHRGTDKSGPVVGAGVLSLGVAELTRLLGSMQATDGGSAGELVKFGRFFVGKLWDVYAPLAKK